MLAYLTAARHKPDAAVGYYGVGIEKRLDLAGKLSCPLLLHFGEKDEHVPPAAVEQIRGALSKDPSVTIYTYGNAGHAFARPGGGNYHHPSADLADMRTLSFLVEKLVGKR
jgi:carboxymethylenebutenolidase